MTRVPTVYTIPPGAAFLDVLAEGLSARTEPLADMLVLLPTRRAARALTHAFLRVGAGRALLLPRIAPIGDVELDELALGAADQPGVGPLLDVPEAVPELRRRMLLTQAILRLAAARGDGAHNPAQAAYLAAELARLLDQVATERLSLARLDGLVPAELARHWQVTLDFLKILTDHWPAILAAEGGIDPADRRNRLIDAQCASWRHSPPAYPVIAAGSTGSIPATASLLAVVASLPNGAVVLPGLDRSLDADTRGALSPSHPQHGMMALLAGIGVTPEQVADWPVSRLGTATVAPARAALIGAAMRPPASDLPPLPIAAALAGVRRIDCPGPREEAATIALLLRQALEDPARTAALITPDRALARRVAAELRRWGIEIDDSAGTSLGETPPGVFLRLVARMVADRLAPISLLAACKHPLAAAGMDPAAFRGLVRRLEIAALRGPRPAPGFDGLRRALAGNEAQTELTGLVDVLAGAAAPFADLVARRAVRVDALIEAHVGLAEALAATDAESGGARLWAGEAGEEAAGFVDELRASAGGFAPIAGAAWPGFFEALMAGRVVRPRYGRHPLLGIWGLLEARLQRAGLVVLGGLNEGTWPADPGPDPWLSRPMRAAFGLPARERRIGQAAHDFAQAFCAPEVVMTRSTRVEGTPTVPSRWLQRLDSVIATQLDGAPLQAAQGQWLGWQAALDRPAAVRPILPPAPCPPLSARPRLLSVTEIETWMQDPYAIYARHVLGLRALDPLDADASAADRGTVIHQALDAFLKAHPDAVGDQALAALLNIGREVFRPLLARPAVWALWWPRFERIARWFVEVERARRATIGQTWTEIRGRLVLAAPGGAFTLVGKADRIDRLPGGGLEIIDYKTGVAPSQKALAGGESRQLALEAAIAAAGGFDGVAAAAPARIAIWQLTGGLPPGRRIEADAGDGRLGAEALAGLHRLVAAFDDPATPYRARPDPGQAPRYSDYLHLARVAEWSGSGGGDTR